MSESEREEDEGSSARRAGALAAVGSAVVAGCSAVKERLTPGGDAPPETPDATTTPTRTPTATRGEGESTPTRTPATRPTATAEPPATADGASGGSDGGDGSTDGSGGSDGGSYDGGGGGGGYDGGGSVGGSTSGTAGGSTGGTSGTATTTYTDAAGESTDSTSEGTATPGGTSTPTPTPTPEPDGSASWEPRFAVTASGGEPQTVSDDGRATVDDVSAGHLYRLDLDAPYRAVLRYAAVDGRLRLHLVETDETGDSWASATPIATIGYQQFEMGPFTVGGGRTSVVVEPVDGSVTVDYALDLERA